MKEYIEREAACAYKPLAKKERRYSTYNLDDAFENGYDEHIKQVEAIPAADVVDGETYRELLKVAKKMHFWIFLNIDDELGAYDECGLTDEMNALLGYDGQFTVKMDGGANNEER